MGLPATKSGSSHLRVGGSGLHCTGKISSLYNAAGRWRAAAAISEHGDRTPRLGRSGSSAPLSKTARTVGRTAYSEQGCTASARSGYSRSWWACFWQIVQAPPPRSAHFAAPRSASPRLRSGAAGRHYALVAASPAWGRPKTALVFRPGDAARNPTIFAVQAWLPQHRSMRTHCSCPDSASSLELDAGNHKASCALLLEPPNRFFPVTGGLSPTSQVAWAQVLSPEDPRPFRLFHHRCIRLQTEERQQPATCMIPPDPLSP